MVERSSETEMTHRCATSPQIYYETKGTFIEWGELYPNSLVDYTWCKPEGDPLMKQKFKGQLEEHVKLKDNILVLGCGNSLLSEYLRVAGWKGNITSVDFSEESVFQCKDPVFNSDTEKTQAWCACFGCLPIWLA